MNGCAFVYGSLSFLDKISCGIALFVLESYEGNVYISKNSVKADKIFVFCPPKKFMLEMAAATVTPCLLLFSWVAGTMNCGETRGLNTVSRYGTGLIPSCFALLSLVVTSTLRLQDTTPRAAAALEAPLLV